MPGPHLVYFADPMCSWCWGFSPTIEAIEQRFGDALPIRLVMGGLRPWTAEPMTEAAKASSRGHWDHVHAASGQPFDYRFFDRSGFVYDTEPASRAVVVMRRRGVADGLAALRAVQHAFYAENRDTTDQGELTAIAAGLGFDAEGFARDFDSEAARQETTQDFALSQGAGVRGFPTLIAGTGEEGRYGLVTNGYQPGEAILPALERWRATVDVPA